MSIREFTADIKEQIRELARKSDIVADAQEEIRDEPATQDDVEDAIEIMYDFYDEDPSRRDVEEACKVVISIALNACYTAEDFDDMSDKAHDSFKDGLEILAEAVDSTGRGRGRRDRGSRRDRDRGSRDRDRGSRRDRDRDRRSSRRDRDDDDRRDRRSDRRNDRSTRPSRTSGRRGEEKATPTRNFGRSRTPEREERETEREETFSSTDRKLLNELADVDLKTLAFVKENVDKLNVIAQHGDKFDAFIDYTTTPKIGGTTGGVGVVTDKNSVLLNGEIEPMEEYMDHELDKNAIRANLARYGLATTPAVKLPEAEEKEVFDISGQTYKDLGPVNVETRYGDLVDYTDLTGAALERLSDEASIVRAEFLAANSVSVSELELKEIGLDNVMEGDVLISNWGGLYDVLDNAARSIAAEKDVLTVGLRRFMVEVSRSATKIYNQLLVLCGAQFQIEDFAEDYRAAKSHLRGQDEDVRADYESLELKYFRSNFNFTTKAADAGLITIFVTRQVDVLYTEMPLLYNNIRISDTSAFCKFTRATCPEVYDMLSSMLQRRKGLTDVVFADGDRNFYSANCINPKGGSAIVLREI